jgi:hypothetical protein
VVYWAHISRALRHLPFAGRWAVRGFDAIASVGVELSGVRLGMLCRRGRSTFITA